MSNATTVSASSESRRNASRILVQFLGSMSLAVTLLVALAIASIIGTILKQNEPFQNYVIKFGPYWFEVFKDMGLFDVYHTLWFIAILAFLVLSTSTCLIRNTPQRLREMRDLRLNMHDRALESFEAKRTLLSATPLDMAAEQAEAELRANGYGTKHGVDEDGTRRVAGHKGAFNRMGYIFTHLAIVVICIGGLMDGNLPLKVDTMLGRIKPEKDFSLPLSQIPRSAQFGPSNPSFRGNVTIPEGDASSVIFIQAGDGYFVQNLGFQVFVKKFHIEHYSTGMPKSFASDVVIYDGGKPVKSDTIQVNHPLIYKGVAIYQASFSDGGSLLNMRGHFLNSADGDGVPMSGRVGDTLKSRDGKYQIELKNFSMFNVVPADNGQGKQENKMTNMGPSFDYIVRDAAGKGVEFKTYMAPFMRDGHGYFLQGLRYKPNDPYQYLFIPLDQNGSVNLFMKYFAAIRDRVGDAKLKPEEVFVRSFQDVVKQYAPDMSQADQAWFFQSAIDTMLQLRQYPIPFVISMSSFQQRQATGLQMTRSPGKKVVYFGAFMLVLGIFIMFYLPHRKIWVRLRRRDDGQTEALVAGSSNRNIMDFTNVFAGLAARIAHRLHGRDG